MGLKKDGNCCLPNKLAGAGLVLQNEETHTGRKTSRCFIFLSLLSPLICTLFNIRCSNKTIDTF